MAWRWRSLWTNTAFMATNFLKVRRLAMKSVLSDKVAENNLVAVEGLSFDAPKQRIQTSSC